MIVISGRGMKKQRSNILFIAFRQCFSMEGRREPEGGREGGKEVYGGMEREGGSKLCNCGEMVLYFWISDPAKQFPICALQNTP